MNIRGNWSPSKYTIKSGAILASRNAKEVSPSSLLITQLIANCYQYSIPIHAKGDLLDLGCGKAPLHALYASYVKSAVWADWGNSLHENQNLDIECDLSERLPFADEKFDTIILSDVLEHIAKPDYLWTEMNRILKQGGKVIMNVPFLYWIHEQPFDYFRYTEFALRRFAEQSGFSIHELKPVGGSLDVLVDILAKHLCVTPVIGRWMARLTCSAGIIFARTPFWKKVSMRTGKNFPLGYFLIAEKHHPFDYNHEHTLQPAQLALSEEGKK